MAAAGVLLPKAPVWRACLSICLAFLPFQSALAEGLYAGGEFAYNRMAVASRDYDTYALKFRLGATHTSGWGVELQGMSGLGDDTVADIEIGIDSVVAAYVRYQYPREADFQLYVLAGYAWTSLSIDGPDTSGLDESFSDFSYAFGIQEKLVRWKNTTAVVEFGNLLSDSNIDLWSLSAGLRYEF